MARTTVNSGHWVDGVRQDMPATEAVKEAPEVKPAKKTRAKKAD